MRTFLLPLALLPFTTGCFLFGHSKAKDKTLGVTGASQALSRITSDPVDESHPTISPDGKTLLFDTAVWDGKKIKQRTIVGVDPNTGAQRTLYTSTNSMAGHPGWLPDGSTFVFTSNSPGDWAIVKALSKSPGSGVTVLVPGSVAPEASFPDVSPAGTHVALSFKPINGPTQIAVVNMDGSHFTILGEGQAPRWSPDGKRITFTRTVNGFNEIFVVDAETGQNLVQVTSGEANNNWPSFSPDGNFIVFDSNSGYKSHGDCGKDECYNLYIVHPDGTGLTQLTDGNSDIAMPQWGVDGWIYFAAGDIRQHDIWRLRPVAPGK
jgi:TolB protein